MQLEHGNWREHRILRRRHDWHAIGRWRHCRPMAFVSAIPVRGIKCNDGLGTYPFYFWLQAYPAWMEFRGTLESGCPGRTLGSQVRALFTPRWVRLSRLFQPRLSPSCWPAEEPFAEVYSPQGLLLHIDNLSGSGVVVSYCWTGSFAWPSWWLWW